MSNILITVKKENNRHKSLCFSYLFLFPVLHKNYPMVEFKSKVTNKPLCENRFYLEKVKC